MLKKTDYKPKQVKPHADVREQITNTLKDQKARTLLNDQAAKLIADLKANGKFDELSKANGVELKQIKAVTRSNAEVDADVLRYAFSMSKPQTGSNSYGSVPTNSGDLAVVVLEAVMAGSFDKVTTEQKTAIVAQLGNIYGRNDFASYQKFLKDSAEIK